jgi:hypothetical protein
MTVLGPSEVKDQKGEAMPSCDMTKDCTEAVTHIRSKGYVYCAKHTDLHHNLGQWSRHTYLCPEAVVRSVRDRRKTQPHRP